MTWKVLFFKTIRGDCPVKDFIEKQDKPAFTKIIRYIELLENYGPFMKPPYVKKIKRNLFELRISGKKSIRIFYTVVDNVYYLLHAFTKKSQKTPRKDLKTALDRTRELI